MNQNGFTYMYYSLIFFIEVWNVYGKCVLQLYVGGFLSEPLAAPIKTTMQAFDTEGNARGTFALHDEGASCINGNSGIPCHGTSGSVGYHYGKAATGEGAILCPSDGTEFWGFLAAALGRPGRNEKLILVHQESKSSGIDVHSLQGSGKANRLDVESHQHNSWGKRIVYGFSYYSCISCTLLYQACFMGRKQPSTWCYQH